MTSICLYPPKLGFGGPGAFAGRLALALQACGYQVTRNPLERGVRTILVIGGSKRLDILRQAGQRGVRIVQRLNGMNWLHRHMNTGLRHFLRAEINNWILATIRKSLAHAIIYQSEFSRDWWQRERGTVKADSTVIFNGVDLQAYAPSGEGKPPDSHLRLLLVEGRLGSGGMHTGLENALALLDSLGKKGGQLWELMVAGEVPASLRAASEINGRRLTWKGVVPRQEIPALDRSAHVLFSADINAACPNSVIEALACGLPVAAYNTGALPEMVTGQSGLVVPYGADHWKLEKPNPAPLAEAAFRIANQQAVYRAGARRRAEEEFDIQKIVDRYLEILV